MTKEEKVSLLAETLYVDEAELMENIVLEDSDFWDSMTKLSVIVMFDDEFEKKIKSDDLKNFVTVGDVLNAMEKGN